MIYHDQIFNKSNNYPLSKKGSCMSVSISNNNSIDKSQSGNFSRKISTSSLKDYVNIDKLIGDIKLTPNKQQTPSKQHVVSTQHHPNIEQNLKLIFKSLSVLKQIPSICDEVRTIELLLQSIDKKLISKTLSDTRPKHNQSLIKQLQSSKKRSRNVDVSPIQQFQDTSRIVYTNFSLKELGQVINNNQNIYENTSIQTPLKKYKQDKQENQQMQKLNNEIIILQKMLKLKGFKNESQNKSKNSGLKDANLFSTLSKNKLVVESKENISISHHESLFKQKNPSTTSTTLNQKPTPKPNIYHDDLFHDKKRINQTSQYKKR